jgi:fructokinase
MLAPHLVFANEAEAELVGELDAETVVVKRGARGCVVVDAEGRRELPAVPADVVDTTGAGDAFAAGFLVGGSSLALDASARCVGMMGATP